MQAVYTRFVSDDNTAEKATNAQQWMTTLCEGMAEFGKPIDNAPQWKDKLGAAGFVDVEEKVLKVSCLHRFPKAQYLSILMHECRSQSAHGPRIHS